MSTLTAYQNGRKIFGATGPSPLTADSLVRHSGEYTKGAVSYSLADGTYMPYVQIAAHAGTKVTLSIVDAGSPSQDVIITEHTPFSGYLDSSGNSTFSINAESVNGSSTPSLDYVFFLSDVPQVAPAPAAFDGPWLVLDASSGVTTSLSGDPESWIDTRLTERSLDQTFDVQSSDIVGQDAVYTESDSDFNGFPSLYGGVSTTTGAGFKYSEAIGAMTGDKSPQFMRGDQDFTVLAVGKFYTAARVTAPVSQLFAASASVVDNPPSAAADTVSRAISYSRLRFGATLTGTDWINGTSARPSRREQLEEKAGLYAFVYSAANRTLQVYAQGEWLPSAVYSDASSYTDFTDVPLIGGGASPWKLNHLTVYKRLITSDELNTWISEQSPKVTGTNTWKNVTMSDAFQYMEPRTNFFYYEPAVTAGAYYDYRVDPSKFDNIFLLEDTGYSASWVPTFGEDGLRTEKGTAAYMSSVQNDALGPITGDLQHTICFTFHGQLDWDNGSPDTIQTNFAAVWGTNAGYTSNTSKYTHTLVKVTTGSVNAGGFNQEAYRYTVNVQGVDDSALPAGSRTTYGLFALGSDGTISSGDTIAVFFEIENATETARLRIKNLTAGWEYENDMGTLNAFSNVDGVIQLDAVVGAMQRSATYSREFATDITLHESSLHDSLNLSDADVDVWFEYVKKRYA